MGDEGDALMRDSDWIDCPNCMLRQRLIEGGDCRRCGAPLSDVEASAAAGAASASGDDGAELQEPSGGDEALDFDDMDFDDIGFLELADDRSEQPPGASADSTVPAEMVRRRERAPVEEERWGAADVAEGLGGLFGGLRGALNVFFGRLRDGDPGARRVVFLFFLLFIVAVASLLLPALLPGEAIEGRRVSSGLGLAVELPDEGWYRERLDLANGAGETFRSARSISDARTLLWIRIINAPADAAGRVDVDSLTASGPWLEEQAFSVLDDTPLFESRSGCGAERVGDEGCVRCRSEGTIEGVGYEFDVFGIEHDGDVLLALLANRTPVTSESFATAYGIIESLVAPPPSPETGSPDVAPAPDGD